MATDGMATDGGRAWSDLPIHPGEILAEELEARGITQRELAAQMGRPPQAINEIIRGKKAMTAETALGLERVLGTLAYASFWLNLETTYRLTLARNREKSLPGPASLTSPLPPKPKGPASQPPGLSCPLP